MAIRHLKPGTKKASPQAGRPAARGKKNAPPAAPRPSARERDQRRQDQAVARTLREREREHRDRMAEAEAVWAGLAAAEQLDAVCRIVETRRHDLCRAYKGVVALAPGFGTRTNRRTGRRTLKDEPCVAFVVGRKRTDRRGAPRRPDDVPRRLLEYVLVGGKLRLCAVPTDVQDRRAFRARAQNAQIVVTDPALPSVTGVITCLVRRPGSPTLYALSCHHVLGMTSASPAAYPTGAAVSRLGGSGTPADPFAPIPPPLGEATGFYGPLKGAEPVSFDAALAQVGVGAGDAGLIAAVKPLLPVVGQLPFAAVYDDIPKAAGDVLFIRTPDGDLEARFHLFWSVPEQLPVDYEVAGLRSVYQKVGVFVLHLLDGKETRHGHSGSPVVNAAGTKLLGMHFAGAGGLSYMLPAYELVRTTNYIGLAKGKILEIV